MSLTTPAESPSHAVGETPSHVLLLSGEPFDVTCLRFDPAFVSWANTKYGTTWDGRMVGSLNAVSFAGTGTPHPGFVISAAFAVAPIATGLSVRFIDDDILTYPFDGIHNPIFSFESHDSGTLLDYGVFGTSAWFTTLSPNPITTGGAPLTFKLLPCDQSNPPEILRVDWGFDTPDGHLGISGGVGLSPNGPNLKPVTVGSGNKWQRTFDRHLGSHAYHLDLSVILTGASDAYAMLGIARDSDPMGFAEFDLLDVPSPTVSPVGILKRGNAHGMDGLPAGITFSRGTPRDAYLSVVGQ